MKIQLEYNIFGDSGEKNFIEYINTAFNLETVMKKIVKENLIFKNEKKKK